MRTKPIYFFIYLLYLSTFYVSAQIPTTGLKAYYPFNGSAIDSTGYEPNNGTLRITNSPIFVTDRTGKGQAINLDGFDDYVTVGNLSRFSLPESRDTGTISIWFKYGTCKKNFNRPQYLLDIYGRNSNGQTRRLSIYAIPQFDTIHKQTNLSLSASAVTGNSTDTEFLEISTTIHDSGWHNAILVWAKPELALYADGSFCGKKQATIPDAKMSTNNKTACFGSDIFTGQKCFCGLLDDIRLYNRVCTATELLALAEKDSKVVVPLFKKSVISKGISISVLPQGFLLKATQPGKTFNSIRLYDAKGKQLSLITKDIIKFPQSEVFYSTAGTHMSPGLYILCAHMSDYHSYSIPLILSH
jgi:hypothetical protein